ncbi:MAG: chloride channel protein [Phycisphaerales bacterium JB039]
MTETIKRLRRMADRLGFERDWYLIVLGALIGVITAFGAVGFAWALRTTEHLSDQAHEALPLYLLPVVPMAGALITGLIVHYGAGEARGHGVPQVIKAILQHRGVIPLRVGLVKVFASVATVGSGGSAGAEGPIIQIGSTAGSVLGQKLRTPREHMATLVGCGAAAGIASIFNAPIAGVFFCLEILVRDFSLRTFAPIVVASVLSTATTQAILGENEAIFEVSALRAGSYQFTLLELPAFLVLGLACGALGVGFSHLLHIAEDTFERIRVHPAIRPVLGALLLGVLGIGFVLLIGSDQHRPAFFGNGYATIERLLSPATYTPDAAQSLELHGAGFDQAVLGLMAALLVGKALATALTLGSGGSGGVFAPGLFMGATFGAGFGLVLDAMGLIPHGSSPAAYALVGMAAFIAGGTHAPLTAILMLFELTRDYTVLLPIMIAAVVATMTAQLIDRDSIYTAKLRRQGLRIGATRDYTVLRRIPVSSVHITRITGEPVYPSDPLAKLIQLHASKHVPEFVVTDEGGKYVGMVTGHDMRMALIDREAIPLLLVAELLRSDMPTISPLENLDTVIDKFAQHDMAALCMVSESGAPLGLVTRNKVMQRYQEELEKQ